MFELILKDGTSVRSKLYADRNKFAEDYTKMTKTAVPFKAQGIGKDGKPFALEMNGWNDDDVILTAVVKFGNDKTYGYSAGKRYSGIYSVKTKYGESIVSVNYKWRDIDEFRTEIWEAGYDEPVSFESILIEKVK